jgi:hypothetical protein
MNAEASVRIQWASPDDTPGLVPTYEWLFAPPWSKPRAWDADQAADALARVSASEDAAVLVARASDPYAIGALSLLVAAALVLRVRQRRSPVPVPDSQQAQPR